MERFISSINIIKKSASRVIAAGALTSGVFVALPGESLAQTQTPDKEPPRSGLFDTRAPFIKPVIEILLGPPKPPIDRNIYEGCELTSNVWVGRATYYSPEGCVGCSPDRRTASGALLNYTDRTLAFMKTPLEVFVRVFNTRTGKSTRAFVNDRGGFEQHGFIADLSPATKEAIGGGDITNVEITQLRNCP